MAICAGASQISFDGRGENRNAANPPHMRISPRPRRIRSGMEDSMSEEYSIKDKLKDIINGTVDYDKQRKASMQGQIDRADHIFQFLLLLFGLGFWIVFLVKSFL